MLPFLLNSHRDIFPISLLSVMFSPPAALFSLTGSDPPSSCFLLAGGQIVNEIGADWRSIHADS
eukprot:scaffold54386_cov46-Attheya_sp.AAC.1